MKTQSLKPMNQRDLEHVTLTPILYLVQECHPRAPRDVIYVKKTGTLTIKCAVCNAVVADIQVAP
jgi:hypothetical protein